MKKPSLFQGSILGSMLFLGACTVPAGIPSTKPPTDVPTQAAQLAFPADILTEVQGPEVPVVELKPSDPAKAVQGPSGTVTFTVKWPKSVQALMTTAKRIEFSTVGFAPATVQRLSQFSVFGTATLSGLPAGPVSITANVFDAVNGGNKIQSGTAQVTVRANTKSSGVITVAGLNKPAITGGVPKYVVAGQPFIVVNVSGFLDTATSANVQFQLGSGVPFAASGLSTFPANAQTAEFVAPANFDAGALHVLYDGNASDPGAVVTRIASISIEPLFATIPKTTKKVYTLTAYKSAGSGVGVAVLDYFSSDTLKIDDLEPVIVNRHTPLGTFNFGTSTYTAPDAAGTEIIRGGIQNSTLDIIAKIKLTN